MRDPVDSILPPKIDRLLTAGLAYWTVFMGRNALLGGRDRTVILDLVMALATALAIGLYRWRPRWLHPVLHFAMGLWLSGLLISSFFNGGVLGPSWGFFAAVPLFALSFGRPAMGLMWSAVAAIGAVLSIVDPLRLPPDFLPGRAEMAFAAAAVVGLSTNFGWLARRDSDRRIAALAATARQRSELLANISHEIRTPLHGVLGLASVIDTTDLNSDQRELLLALRSSGRVLNRIVDDVLDVARLESGRTVIEPAPFDLYAALEDIVDLHAADAASAGLVLVLVVEGAEHLAVTGDDVRIRQIVTNLVANAVKYTSGGSVVVRARARREGPQIEIVIRVEDTGPGIPADRIDRLFVAFDRLDSTQARLHGGTGLGLALARDLALRMGGTLDAERGRTIGSALELRLHLPPASMGLPALPTRRGTVLAIEAEPLHAMAARSMARALDDVELIVVETIVDARAAIASRSPNVVVLCASASLDPDQTRAALATSIPIVVARSASASSGRADATTLRPLRRSRLRMLLSAAMPAARPVFADAGRTALVVDDDPTNRRVMVRLLESRGWSARAAGSATAALEALSQTNFDVVLCDLHMPEIDGVELRRRTRALAPRGRFIVVTASVRESDRARALAAGFDGFLRKPFEPAELDELLVASTDAAAPSAIVDGGAWRAFSMLMGREADEALREQIDAARGYVQTIIGRADDAAESLRAAHTLASSSSAIGMRSLGEAAAALERRIDSLTAAERAAEGRALAALLDRSIAALEAIRGAIDTKESR